MLHLMNNSPASAESSWKDVISLVVPFLAAIVALIGVLLTIRSTAQRQREADERRWQENINLRDLDRANEIRVARAIIFAQLSRVYRTIQGEYEYLANSPLTYVWIAVYPTLLPSEDNLRRIQVLTAEEVLDVTAFLYSYHENVGYIASLNGDGEENHVKYDFQLVGVDYQNPQRELAWLVGAMGVIERKALRAMDAILAAALHEYDEKDQLRCRLQDESSKSRRVAEAAEEHKHVVAQRIVDAKTVA
jgi:hypothetical protein